MNQPTNQTDDTADGVNVPDEDTQGHGARASHLTDAGGADTEGHLARVKVERAGKDDDGDGDDTEGHAGKFRI